MAAIGRCAASGATISTMSASATAAKIAASGVTAPAA